MFSQTLGGVDGVIITKLDGTSKGGAIFSIIHTLRVPILYIGVGEGAEDLIEFDESQYIQTILDSIFEWDKPIFSCDGANFLREVWICPHKTPNI